MLRDAWDEGMARGAGYVLASVLGLVLLVVGFVAFTILGAAVVGS